jgi:hypothetical protein
VGEGFIIGRMDSVAPEDSREMARVRRKRILSFTAYVVLIAVTGIVAVRLVPFSIYVGQDVWHDAQNDEQRVASWRGAAVFAYTSGGWAGHLCALVAGLVVGRWAMLSTRQAGLSTAVLAGAGLGLTDLVLAAWTAAPRLRELASAAHLTREDGVQVIDPGLGRHGCVFVAVIVAFALFLIAAYVGFCVVQADPVYRALLVPAVIIAPVAYYVINFVLVPRPGPY